MKTLQKIGLLLLVVAMLGLTGCASTIPIAPRPLILSEPPAKMSAKVPVSIALVKLPRPVKLGEQFDPAFAAHLGNTIEAGMLDGLRLISDNVTVVNDLKGSSADLILVPTNLFVEQGKATYGIEVTVSMEVRVIQKGQSEKGLLIEGRGLPDKARPFREVRVSDNKYGLIGGYVQGSPFALALNQALFEFSVQFTQKVDKRAKFYLRNKNR